MKIPTQAASVRKTTMKTAAAAGLAALMLALAGCSDEGGNAKSSQAAAQNPPQAGFITVKAETVTLSANVAG
ncbi:MAG: hypothetical protein EON48_18905, partial [Acetobacteraceae bacterium]